MATWVIGDLIERVGQVVQGDEELTVSTSRLIVGSTNTALERYNRDKPNKLFYTGTGDDTQRYALTNYDEDNGDVIKSVEYPIDNVPPRFLDSKYYETYQTAASSWELLFLESAIPTGESFKVVWTRPRTLATILSSHKEAFAQLCAHFVALSIAAREANRQDSTVSAGTVDKGTGAAAWRARATDFLQAYQTVVQPLRPKEVQAAEVTTSVESTFAGRGATRAFHRYETGLRDG